MTEWEKLTVAAIQEASLGALSAIEQAQEHLTTIDADTKPRAAKEYALVAIALELRALRMTITLNERKK